MLELKNVRKAYTTGDFTQVALDDVSITFRESEFVAVLGASGSGKTTMLNLVGGLDQYDSGDLLIDGVSTKQYRDRDWDTYRNNRVGFVFQSYNLIPHQSVLANVELALTLAGVSRTERRRRAQAALTDVGLEDHIHKKPSQLSGGQMQRVAIARALINDPEILLADEPTGALDSQTSVQIMGLLTKIAEHRLVIMVTHNPELADEYATRIVQLSDGKIIEDSDPYRAERDASDDHERIRHTSMGFLTAIALSFNNLMTKKGRTLMTSFAGSIGIIGIAAILALANGVNAYIKGVEEDTLSQYPLTIQAQGFDMAAMFATSSDLADEAHGEKAGDSEVREVPVIANMFSSIGTNDLKSLKTYLDDGGGGIDSLVNGIEYSYDITPHLYSPDLAEGPRQVNPDPAMAAMGFVPPPGTSSMATGMRTSAFAELVDDLGIVQEGYDVVAGRWPNAYDETIVVLTASGSISDLALYGMGLKDPREFDEMVRKMMAAEEVEPPAETQEFSYDEVLNATFKLINPADYYVRDSDFDVWVDKQNDENHIAGLVRNGEELKVVGIVKPAEEGAQLLSPGIYYTRALTNQLMAEAAEEPIVKEQLDDPATNVFTGRDFSDDRGQRDELDMTDLFSIDEDAIGQAFRIDESKLQPDLSGLELELDPSAIEIDPASLPPLELDGLMDDFDPSTMLPEMPDMEELAAAGNLPEGALPPLQTGQVLTQAPQFVDAYTAHALANGTDPADLATSLPAFVDSPEAAALFEQTAEDLQVEATAVQQQLTDYFNWAAEQNVDPNDVGANVQVFIGQQQQQAMEQAMAAAMSTVDMEAFEQELGERLQAALANYMQEAMGVVMADVGEQLSDSIGSQLGDAMQSTMGDMATQMQDAVSIDEEAFMDAFTMEKSQDELTQLLMSMASTQNTTYETNLHDLGYATPESPALISIYPTDFEAKEQVIQVLDRYNDRMTADGQDDKVISYSDFVGALMTSVTDIINTISYVLIAFVAISLIVSSIMIGVITYISVLERRKEIGILRAVGASKRDIRRVFNAETLIVGFVAGLIGVVITALLTIPANAIVEAKFDVPNVAILPWQAALILILISMGLTSLAGLLPASSASRKDPVEALRSE